MQRQDFQHPVGGDIIFSIVKGPAVAPIETLQSWNPRGLGGLQSSNPRGLGVSVWQTKLAGSKAAAVALREDCNPRILEAWEYLSGKEN